MTRRDNHILILIVALQVIIGIYITCFGIGVFNHARDFAAYGWRPYDWGPFLLEVFWSGSVANSGAVAKIGLLDWQDRLR